MAPRPKRRPSAASPDTTAESPAAPDVFPPASVPPRDADAEQRADPDEAPLADGARPQRAKGPGRREGSGSQVPRATPQPAIHAETFRELDRRSLAHDAAEQLKSLISEGVLSPGDKLPAERVLSARLGVSRPTLREAVRGLVIMGLLESRHGAGTFVAHGVGAASGTVSVTIDLEDPLDSLFELRLLLEPVMAERAAAHITDAVVRELRRLLETMESRVSEPEAFLQLDADFHRVIHVAAESRFMLSILDAIAEPAIRGRRLSSRRPGVTRRTLTEHEIILDALERRDPFEARAAMTAHLVHIRAELIGQTT